MRKLMIGSLAAVAILVVYGFYLGIADVNSAGNLSVEEMQKISGGYGSVCDPADPTCIPDCEHLDKCVSGPTCGECWDGETPESCGMCYTFIGQGIIPYLREGPRACNFGTEYHTVICGSRFKCAYYSWAGCIRGDCISTRYIRQCYGDGMNMLPPDSCNED